MKKLTGIILLALAVFSFQLGAIAAEPIKIGVLDLQRCIQESNEGKRIDESLKKKQTAKLEEIRKKEQELRDMNSELEKQSLMLSQEAKENKLKEFEKKQREYNYFVQDAREEMQKLTTDARIAILNVLSGVVQTIAKEKNFDLITEKQNGGVLFVAESLDITDEVIAELNKVKP